MSGLPDAFREVMAGVATPVAVVTTLSGGDPHGTTVSSFASLSLAPPMVMAALDRSSSLLGRLAVGAPFGVNVLGSSQADLAGLFARRAEDRFAGVAWSEDTGAPRLGGCPGWLACEVSDLVPGGDHVIVLATVLHASAGSGAPLTYHGRRFGTHTPVAA
ncbi:flavin reductase family protein [Geodermatophilus nigrescens]|uniref:NADH-FMN oxidoreductase RutF, flavin reductase (DIM6/NTAB) family n=1 Tax=Geodermatophilus nigrescens TaxID=1070870 RepID=A0A1M5M0N3_9ACTN|nr:flavin reductase family protein [Geodermatophilus nigrescens]SHG70892.1 NADH-FMN oxidoreductase RutF, flavin reductase (DIM6/NTAB) family [Geodermatophilus nigrescens]